MWPASEAGTASSGRGVFYDGATSRRQTVELACEDTLVLRDPAAGEIARWPFDELRRVAGAPDVLRLTLRGGPELARLEVRDRALAAEIGRRAGRLDESQATERGGRRAAVLWSLAAVVSLSLIGVFGMPAIASRLAPLLPWSVDQRLGAAVDPQVRGIFGATGGGSGECGERPGEEAGRAAFGKLVAALNAAAGLPIDIRAAALRSPVVNALALPGGYMYILDGLLDRLEGPDELAGILAHELGHIAARDGTKKVLQTTGTSFLFGTILGDFAGGGAVVLAAQTLTSASYSREAEAAADGFAVELLREVGAEPRALARALARIAAGGGRRGIVALLASHPVTEDRVEAIERAARPGAPRPILSEAEWRALKAMCKGRPR